ncbi:MAG TPA: dTMP kinase [Pirellulaceae bacterium]|nr:dTMP kinase [Pirellulaceae bacterium]
MFFSFDGVDGAGKSTQIKRFCDWLGLLGHDVVTCRDPGSTDLGERVRELLLGSHGAPIHRRTEMLLFMAARAQLVEELLRPALAVGKTIVSDRYLLANLVYQGYAGGLDLEVVREVGAIAIAGIRPTLTFLLDVDPDIAAQRMGREPDRMEAFGLDYLRGVRAGFLAEAKLRPNEIVVIDAAQDPDAVHAQIQAHAWQRLQPQIA